MSNAYDKASLVMIPTAQKEGKVYSAKPTDGSGDFAFSRGADTATRVNEQGYIEKERGNVLLQSNQFDTTWSVENATTTSGQSGYDGLNNAWLLENTTTDFPRTQQNISLNEVVTISLYAKAGTNNFIRLLRIGVNTAQVYFDLSNGAIANESSIIDSNITSVGNGWYRCSGTFTGATTSVRIYSADSVGSFALGNTLIQDAQLEKGLVATDYIETTTVPVYSGILDNTPRLDYSNGATCPSLLLEPQRTNFINFSEYYSQYNSTRSTITDNYGISPDGSQNAAGVFNTSSNGRHNVSGRYFAVTSGTSYVNSVFAKAGTITKMKLRLYSGGGTSIGFNDGDFDLINGTATGTGAGIESYGNGWYRCYVVDSPTSSVSNTRFNLELLNASGGVSYVGSVTDYIEIFGSQVEAGSYPTSYIPTYGTSVTRTQEAVANQSIPNTPSLWSCLIDVDFSKMSLVNNKAFFNTITTTGVMSWRFFNKSGAQVISPYFEASASYAFDTNIDNNKTDGRVLLRHNGGGSYTYFRSYLGVVTQTTATGLTETDLNQINFNGNDAKWASSQILVFPTALSDAECIELTTI